LGLLKESLGSSDYTLFSGAVRAALEMPDAAVTRALASRLPQLRTDNQIVVIQALGTRADTAVIPALTPLLQAGEKPVRLAAVRAVAALGKSASLTVLVGLLDSGEVDMVQAAKDGLAGIPGREADKAVLALMQESRPERRAAGIVLVGRRRVTAALPELVKAANDDDATVRLQAWQRLGELGTAAQVPALLEALLRASDSQTLDAAGEALSSICSRAGKSEAVSDEVINAAGRAQPKQKGALLGVLRSLGGDKALGCVRGAVRDPNSEVRNAGIRALSDWSDATAAPDLLQVAQSSTEPVHRALAFRGYIRVAREHAPSTSAKLKLLREAFPVANSADDKKLVLSSLADIPAVESLQLVAPYLSEPALADEAGAAAVKIAEKLNAKFKSDMAPVLNQVLKSAKSEPVLEKARKRMEQLELKPE
jgi:HEAT repeat protein